MHGSSKAAASCTHSIRFATQSAGMHNRPADASSFYTSALRVYKV
jgi:hypothetical protein